MRAVENDVLEPQEPSTPAIRSTERAPEPRFAAHLDEAQRLIQAGLDEMRERQCVEPRVADIVRRAGLSNKAFYRHFRSRDELLLAILEQGLRVQISKLEQKMAQADSALDRIRCWIWEILGRALDPEAAAATRPLLVHQARLLESVGEELWDCVERLKLPLRAAIAEAMASGELTEADVESDTEVVYQLAMGWMHGRLITPEAPTWQEAQRVVEFAIRGLERRFEQRELEVADQIYTRLMEKFAKRGGVYPGMDIPEFYEMAQELFSPVEASVAVALPKGFSTAEQVAQILGREREEVESILKAMVSKGLCASGQLNEERVYVLPPFVPGIFEYQFLRGTRTERDVKLARLIHQYKEALDAIRGIPEISFPPTRVITVDEKVAAGNKIHTYDQMSTYVENSDPISVGTCYCRHEAELLDENDTCGKPNEVCMQFGPGARFVIETGMGRAISKKEALDILKSSEQQGLVHCSSNHQNIDFVCNCCADHCVILKTALAQPKPGLALNSGFEPRIDQEECIVCEVCIDNCPATALAMSEEEILELDLDRCFGCGVCATTCPTDAISLVAKVGYPEPPLDQQSMKRALKAAAKAS